MIEIIYLDKNGVEKTIKAKEIICYTEIKDTNKYKRWTKEEDQLLLEEYKKSMDLEEISKKFGRTQNSISSRLVKLLGIGCIDSTILGIDTIPS